MADNYLSGLSGNVLVGGTAYSFKSWKLSMKNKLINRNNFTVGGYNRFITGFQGATLTLQGPYNAGNMPLVCGASYVFTLQWSVSLSIIIVCFVESLDPDDDAEDGPNVSVTAQASGTFTAAIA